MHFGFDDDQLAFRDAVRDLLDKECTPADGAGRVGRPAPATLDRGVWDRLSEMGVLATLVPEAADGLGLDEQALVLVLEEAGRAGLPHPLVETAAVAAPLVAGGGEGPGPAGVPDAHGLGMVASDLGGPHVACAADADWLLLRDPPGRRAAPRRPGRHRAHPRRHRRPRPGAPPPSTGNRRPRPS